MINLLSPQTKREIRAARLNVTLRKYLLLGLMVVVGMAAIYGGGFYLVTNDEQQAEAAKAAGQTDMSRYATVQQQAAAFTANLAIAKKILSSEITYSTFLTNTASIMPPNTILSSLTLSTAPTGAAKNGQTTLAARGKNYEDILNLKDKLEASNLFSNVSIASTTKPDDTSKLSGVAATYPVDATLNVTITALTAGQH